MRIHPPLINQLNGEFQPFSIVAALCLSTLSYSIPLFFFRGQGIRIEDIRINIVERIFLDFLLPYFDGFKITIGRALHGPSKEEKRGGRQRRGIGGDEARWRETL